MHKLISTYLRLLLLGLKARGNLLSSSLSRVLPCHERLVLVPGKCVAVAEASYHPLTLHCSCPTECRLAHSTDSWKCTVSLRFIKDPNGQLLGTARNEQFGDIIYDKEDVEERLRRAQRAILNPKRRPSEFLDGEDEDLIDNQLSFSANFVSLQISGPGVADLSFCDLPGLSTAGMSLRCF